MLDIYNLSIAMVHEIASLAKELDILNERKYRDLCIKIEFDKMRKEGITVEEAEILLAEQFSYDDAKITDKTIHGIIYKIEN